MDLQISVFLLFILFTAGHSFSCYECTGLNGSCADQKLKTCPSGSSKCMSLTAITQAEISVKVKIKDCAPACQSGSMNFGFTIVTSFCCYTDLCNVRDAPDHSNVTNGKKCYTIDLQNRTTILSCSGTEDRCIKATATLEDQSLVIKGCASKSICEATSPVPNVKSVSCCEGNLCNSAQSVSQSFLFLCCSLLSYFLLH
ncbi:phospholipase A2 inhibitor and Ly6/PLAUR domain-containing protein-like isoform X5 [Ctenopharyngodon idella]|uniref:phospholipase A2 inhibitor and Ly6/PLAUR domain-containing protein-like isoform X5 n=1 Tax=Ctenopharyngodon idella TaxID=7959 RepID=UPI0022306792|nr:phospholipase A2 inhibitor and Ly6/PLAUR domain-containing protein-like isoform X5 [Ctenopharyngodon idella]